MTFRLSRADLLTYLLLQEQLYYLLAPSRDSALASAYMEALKAKDLEVSRQWLVVSRK